MPSVRGIETNSTLQLAVGMPLVTEVCPRLEGLKLVQGMLEHTSFGSY